MYIYRADITCDLSNLQVGILSSLSSIMNLNLHEYWICWSYGQPDSEISVFLRLVLTKHVANDWRGRRCQHPKYPANYQWWISVPSSRTHTCHSHGVFLSISNISLYIFLLQASSFFKVQLSQLLVTEGMVANVTNKWKFNNSPVVTSDALLVLG